MLADSEPPDLASEGVWADHAAIGAQSGGWFVVGMPSASADEIPTLCWDRCIDRDRAETVFTR